MAHSTLLNELGRQALSLKNVLTLAANTLAQGQSILAEAQRLISKPFIPAWMYHLLGGIGFRPEARR